jgi:acylphosphatase
MEGLPMQKAHLIVTGRVQGVFYRANAQKKGEHLGLSGWVRNTSDGAVEAEAVGPKDVIEMFIEWCRRGPPEAFVKHVEVSWEEIDDADGEQERGFYIR